MRINSFWRIFYINEFVPFEKYFSQEIRWTYLFQKALFIVSLYRNPWLWPVKEKLGVAVQEFKTSQVETLLHFLPTTPT